MAKLEDSVSNRRKKMSENPALKYIEEKTALPEQPLIYHYTNVEALFNGIIVKSPEKDKEICLWASNCEYMNDPEEIQTGFKLINKVFHADKKKVYDTKTINLAKESCFLISFSALSDSLPMWGMYGKNGSGITLGFDHKVLTGNIASTSSMLHSCMYIDSQDHSELKSILFTVPESDIPENFDRTNKEHVKKLAGKFFLNLLESMFTGIGSALYLILTSKHPAYSYEKEIRLLEFNEDKSLVKSRHRGNLVIPYIEKCFPKAALKEIWIGPASDMKRSKKSIETFLNANGFGHVKVRLSKVPYRGI